MRLSHKVGKIRSGQAFESAQRHIRRKLLDWQRGIRLDPEGLIKAIDADQFEAIRKRYVTNNPGNAWLKYLDLQTWMAINLRRVRDLELDRGSSRRILDLGCGAGYFLFISQCLGHEVVGLDIDEAPMFGELIAMLGLRRVIWRVQPFVPLPKLGEKFDLITAFMICFNGHKSPNLWGTNEWQFFLDDLETQLTPRGRICLGFNREEDGNFYSEELRQFFESREAKIHSDSVILPSHRGRSR
ncbi:MAG: class I SAM-dependent methyltransferase [Chthoniobacterales bacterium]